MLSILLLDESVSIKRALEIGLQDWNPHIKALSSKVDAREAVRKHKPHLVFIDVLASGRNGYDLCKEMKVDPELKVFPVILLFSHFAPLDQMLFEQSGANGSLEKPFRSETLRQCIKPLLSQDQQHPFQAYLEMPDMGHDMGGSAFIPPDTYRLDPHSMRQEGGIQDLEEQMLRASTSSLSSDPLSPHYHKTKAFSVKEEATNLSGNQFPPSPQPPQPSSPFPQQEQTQEFQQGAIATGAQGEREKRDLPLETTKTKDMLHFEMAPMEALQRKEDHLTATHLTPQTQSGKGKGPFSGVTEDIPEGLSLSPTEKSYASSLSSRKVAFSSDMAPSQKELRDICQEQLQVFFSSEAFLSLVREEVQKIFSHGPKQTEMEKVLKTAIEKALWQALPHKMESMIRDRIDALIQDV